MGVEAIMKAAQKKVALEAAVGLLTKKAAPKGKRQHVVAKRASAKVVLKLVKSASAGGIEKRAVGTLAKLLVMLRRGGRGALRLGSRGLGAIGVTPGLGGLGQAAQRGSEAMWQASKGKSLPLALGVGGAGLGAAGLGALMAKRPDIATGGVLAKPLADELRKSYAYSKITPEQMQRLVQQLQSQGTQ